MFDLDATYLHRYTTGMFHTITFQTPSFKIQTAIIITLTMDSGRVAAQSIHDYLTTGEW